MPKAKKRKIQPIHKRNRAIRYDYIIGVDTGKYGAICRINKNGKLISIEPTKYTKGRIDVDYTADYLSTFDPRYNLACIESTFDPSKKGTKETYLTNNFSFGRNTMCPEAQISALGFDYAMVPSISWEAHFALLHKNKSDACRRATVLYCAIEKKNRCDIFEKVETYDANCGIFGTKKKTRKIINDGFADAYLIAQYARQIYLEEEKK